MRLCRRRKRRYSRSDRILILVALLQIGFWEATVKIVPTMEVVPMVPGLAMAKAFAFGDDQFYFRAHVLEMQTAGITYGRFVKLEEFDYRRLYFWFKLLDVFDSESASVPYMASYWYSRTPNNSDLRFMVDYLQEYTQGRLDKTWRWQMEALNIANYKLNDKDLALNIALPLQYLHDVPIIVRELPAFIYEQRGEMQAARAVMEGIKGDAKLPEGEMHFMNYFLEKRLAQEEKGPKYFEQRQPVSFVKTEPAPAPHDPEERKLYAEADIRHIALLGFTIGMTEEEAITVLKKDQWKGEWRPFVNTTYAYPFEKDGNNIWLYRVKGSDNRLHIWMVVYKEYFAAFPDFNMLAEVIRRQYGAPSEMNIHPQQSAYLYYHTPQYMAKLVSPKFEIEIGTHSMSAQLADETMLPVVLHQQLHPVGPD